MTLFFESEKPEAKAVLRLMNGPLCGCEYRLGAGATLVVAGAAGELIGSSDTADGGQPAEPPEFPDHTIVVPMKDGRNFEIIVDDDACDGFRLRTLSPQPEESLRPYQEICYVGALAFAVRPAQDDWDAGLMGALPRTVAPAHERPRHRAWLLLGLAALFTLFLLIAAGLMIWNDYRSNERVADVAAVVAGSIEQYRLLKGNDGAIFVFAQSERDASWARQALSRQGLGGSVRITTLGREESRLDKLLLVNFPAVAFHRVKLGDPEEPMLVLSQERGQISQQTRRSLLSSLMVWMPYARGIDIASWSDAMLDAQARTGLDRLGIAYERVANTDSVTYTVQKDLNDIDLARLQEFTEGFYRDFGARYVYFSAALQDDRFKGKSYKYGGPGYIKITQHHWFFPHTF